MNRPLDRSTLRYLAVLPMGFGHVLMELYHTPPWSGLPGWLFRLAAVVQFFAPPVFFFCIAEGCRYTRSKKQYALRLAVLAAVTQLTEALAFYGTLSDPALLTEWNVCVSLLAGMLAAALWQSERPLPLRLAGIAGLLALTALLHAEWAVWGPLAILGFLVCRAHPLRGLWWFAGCMLGELTGGFLHWQPLIRPLTLLQLAMLLLAYGTVTLLYNGRRGRHPQFTKWFFYLFYPLHYLLVFVLKYT